jgi:hypothetical protein
MAPPIKNLVVMGNWRKKQKMAVITRLNKQNHRYKTAKIKKEKQRRGIEETT